MNASDSVRVLAGRPALPRGDYPPLANTSLALELDRLDIDGLMVMFAHELVRVAGDPDVRLDWRDEVSAAIARKRAPAEHCGKRYAPVGDPEFMPVQT